MAAEKGFAPAQYNLSRLYLFGEGVEKNLNRSVDLLRQAAEGGYAPAQYDLAIMLQKGARAQRDFLAKDLRKARQLQQKAANQGYIDAMIGLAQMMSTGQGGDRDVSSAVTLYQQAAKARIPDPRAKTLLS